MAIMKGRIENMETSTVIIIKGIFDTIVIVLSFMLCLYLVYKLGYKDGYRKCKKDQKELNNKEHKKSIFIDL